VKKITGDGLTIPQSAGWGLSGASSGCFECRNRRDHWEYDIQRRTDNPALASEHWGNRVLRSKNSH